MKQNLISSLFSDLWSDLRDPGLLWQLAALIASLAFGWALARLVRGRLAAQDVQFRGRRLRMENFARLLWPLLALAFIAAAKLFIAQWHQVKLLQLAMPLVGSFALIRIAFHVLRRVFARDGQTGGALQVSETAFATLVWGGVALYLTGLLPGLLAFLDETVIPLGRHKASLLVILQAGASVAITLVIALWAGAVLEERLMRMDAMHSSLRAVMARMGRAVLILVAVLVSLSLVGIDLTVLSVFGGALGVGIGLGLQKIVSSYFSGFVILLERSLAIGDMVTVDKYSGQVTQINTRYTVVRGGDGVETVVPNEMLVSGTVQNHSLSDRTVRLVTSIVVGYKTDIDLVLDVLGATVAGVERVCRDPAPRAFLVRFAPDGFELEIGFWITDPENGRLSVLSDVNRAIWKTLQLHQVEVPYPQREVRVLAGAAGVRDGALPMPLPAEIA